MRRHTGCLGRASGRVDRGSSSVPQGALFLGVHGTAQGTVEGPREFVKVLQGTVGPARGHRKKKAVRYPLALTGLRVTEEKKGSNALIVLARKKSPSPFSSPVNAFKKI